MTIELQDDGNVKVTMTNDLEAQFWSEIKRKQRDDEATINSLMKENKGLREELSYLKLKAKND